MTDLKREVGRFDFPQEFCPECFEADDISDEHGYCVFGLCYEKLEG